MHAVIYIYDETSCVIVSTNLEVGVCRVTDDNGAVTDQLTQRVMYIFQRSRHLQV